MPFIHVNHTGAMMKTINPSIQGHQEQAEPQQFDWKVSVDIQQIDFLQPDALFVAGSSTNCDGCSISPLPKDVRRARKQSTR
jgi:hypothetical protein